MITAALVSFVLLLLAWLLAPAEAPEVRRQVAIEPERAVADAV